jgi:hypothetical protein
VEGTVALELDPVAAIPFVGEEEDTVAQGVVVVS